MPARKTKLTAKAEAPIVKQFVTRAELANLFGVNPKRISELVGVGIVIKGEGRTAFNAPKSLANYLEHLRKQASGNSTTDGDSLANQRLQTESLKRQILELNLAKETGKVFTEEQVTVSWANFANAVKRKFMSLPGKVSGVIAHLTPQDREVMRRIIVDDLKDLADEVEQTIVSGDPAALKPKKK